MKSCIIFLSHHTQPGAMAALASLRQQCESSFDIIPLFDHTKGAFAIEHIPGARGITCKQVSKPLPYRKKHKQHPGTFWPRNIDLPLRSPTPVPERERVRALLPLYRLSNIALRALHDAYSEGWSGHYEVTIATILRTRGLTLEDIGGSGSYVGAGNHNRF